ncbi:RNA-directed DNA polymerase, eukaryota, reverse transcriptase zinc-binding domain protein [Tanacetum coccineum]
MRNQRQSKVPLRFEDTIHNINNSKANKKKTGSKKKEHEIYKESGEGNRESRLSKGAYREDGVKISNSDGNVGSKGLNDEENNKELHMNLDDVQNNLDFVLSNEDIGGVFGTAANKNQDNVVKIIHVPLEAWSVKGISVLASGLGTPIVMDSMTASMCHRGIGNLSYVRVLVEMDATKELKNEIDIQYVDKNKNVKGSKKVQVVYDWKPPSCSCYKVFGHDIRKCKNGGVVNNNNEGLQNVGTSAAENTGNEQQDNSSKFVTQGRKKISKPENFNNQNLQQQKQVNGSWRMENKKHNGYKDNRKNNAGNNVENNKWKVMEKVVENLRNIANKFSVLNTLPDDNDQELRTLKERMVIDKFLNEKV